LVSSKQATVGFSPFPGWHPAALITPQEFLMLINAKQEACQKQGSWWVLIVKVVKKSGPPVFVLPVLRDSPHEQ
jgi:hypothetical protein